MRLGITSSTLTLVKPIPTRASTPSSNVYIAAPIYACKHLPIYASENQPDFAMMVFNGTDTVSHALWKFMDQSAPAA